MSFPATSFPLWRRTAADLAALIAHKEVSSVEVVRAHLDRIAALDHSIRAFTEVLEESALSEAHQRDNERARGNKLGPLHGVPVSIKECIDLRGKATTLGFRSKVGHKAERDAAIVTLLRDAGAVILGRTNLAQGMLFSESRNPLFGQTANPFSLAHSPGGSSGGESAAVAAGMSCLGIGTDIGGSIRAPASFTGVMGLMPTIDRWPMTGIAPGLPGQESIRACVGPIARSTRDLTLVMTALDPKRIHERTPTSPPVPFDPPPTLLRGLRIGVWKDDGNIPASKALVRAIERAEQALAARGCEIVPYRPKALPDVVFTYIATLLSDGGRTLAAQADGTELDPVLNGLMRLTSLPRAAATSLSRVAQLAREPQVARLLSIVGERRISDLWKLVWELRGARAEVLEAMRDQRIDVLMTPPFATPAVPHMLSKDFALAASYTFFFNAIAFPAGVVPISRVRADETSRQATGRIEKQAAEIDRQSAGLPVGVQLAVRPWEDSLLLGVMTALEDEVRGDPDFPQTPVDPTG